MKKIYLTMAGLVAFGFSYGQSTPTAKKPSASHVIANPHPQHLTNPTKKTASGVNHLVRSIFAEGIINTNLFTAGVDYNVYANPIFMDSTVVSSDASGTGSIQDIKPGVTFDPISIFLDGSNNAFLTSSDAYTVDSLWIGIGYGQVPGSYSVVDTLVVEMTWGLPSTATIYQSLSIASTTPSMVFRTPKMNSSPLHGLKSFFTGPAANRRIIKVPLTSADTSGSVKDLANFGYIILDGVNQSVPAGNIVSVSYTYKPGSVVAPGSIIQAYTGGAPQDANGIVGYLYSDPSTTSNYKFYDPTSFSGGNSFITKQRYGLFPTAQAFLNSCALPNTEGSWDIGFSVTKNTTVGMNDLAKNTFGLTQNVPNPFTKESTVNYNLAKDVNSAVFTVTDIMGRTVSSEKVETTTGTHAVKLGAYAAGVYYYSLNVDGNVTTKKMIVE
jgi:hypothetical protein